MLFPLHFFTPNIMFKFDSADLTAGAGHLAHGFANGFTNLGNGCAKGVFGAAGLVSSAMLLSSAVVNDLKPGAFQGAFLYSMASAMFGLYVYAVLGNQAIPTFKVDGNIDKKKQK